MDILFLEIEICANGEEKSVYMNVPSLIALYVYRFLDNPENIELKFIQTIFPKGTGKLKLYTTLLQKHYVGEIISRGCHKNAVIQDLCLPIYMKDQNTYISGMCAVCREIISRHNCPERRKLLGFKESCLLAPTESSLWTRFCEIDIVTAINTLLSENRSQRDELEMPLEVVRFERHMNEPVRMHNIYKLARERANQQNDDFVKLGKMKKGKIIIECNTPKDNLEIEHRFAEGVIFTIADIILYPLFCLIFQLYPDMLELFPLTRSWLDEINNFETSCRAILHELIIDLKPIKREQKNPLKIPECEMTSLYKSDPKRYKPKNRIYTDQTEVDQLLDKLQSLDITFTTDCNEVFDVNNVDWDLIEPEHAKKSALPKDRIMRKRQQLENLSNAVSSLAANGDRIIDFCSGTGHLGILLAAQLPQCTIILMENKAFSLHRAKKRAEDLNLKNILFYQCNIDYFKGKFDIGTSLHACGTATDIVLQQCRRAKANFVCCPCCYGSLQPMPHIEYPLSKRFRTTLNEKQYLYIAHTADQAHELGTLNCKPETTRQGQLCMAILDTDRKLRAEEAGYHVILTRLQPEKCTPKNHLLVGKYIK